MSRASKIFLGGSLAFMGATIWGVHWMQQEESNNMYQGILRDEARLRAKASSSLSSSSSSPNPPVVQPQATLDPDCTTCVISPPPQLLQAQTKEQRARERKARLDEYEAQKGLQARLERVERVQEGERRLV